MFRPNKIKKYFLLLIIAELIFAHANLAFAQTADYRTSGVEAQIKQYLCTPSTGDPSSGSYYPGTTATGNNDLFLCVNKLYRFAIAAGSVIAIFFIVIAGYIYMASDGNQESVDRAKNIFVTSITAMVILFGGYVLLRALNPDLLKFTPITPPSISLGTAGGTPISGGTSIQHYNFAGFDIGPYATDPQHEVKIAQIYQSLASVNFSSAASITQYMRSKAPSTPVTGDMVLNAAQQYNVDPKLIVALIQNDSSFGTAGVGARTHNPGNVGNDDAGNQKDWGTWQAGVNAVADWLNRHRATS